MLPGLAHLLVELLPQLAAKEDLETIQVKILMAVLGAVVVGKVDRAVLVNFQELAYLDKEIPAVVIMPNRVLDQLAAGVVLELLD
jgi:hypothetical protein